MKIIPLNWFSVQSALKGKSFRLAALLTIASLTFGVIPAEAATPSATQPKLSADASISRLIVKYAPGVEAIAPSGGAVGAERITASKILPGDDLGSGMRTVRLAKAVSAEEARALADQLAADPRILWAEPDQVMFREPDVKVSQGLFDDPAHAKGITPHSTSPSKLSASNQVQATAHDVTAQTACTATSSVEPIARCFDDSDYDAGASVDAEIVWSDAYVKSANATKLVVDIVPYAAITDDTWLTLSDTWLEVDFDITGDGASDVAITPEWTNIYANGTISANVSRNVDSSWIDQTDNCGAQLTRKLADHAAISGTVNSWWEISSNWSCLFAGQTSNVRVATYLEDYWAYDLSPDYFTGDPMNFSSLVAGAPTITTISPATGPTGGGTTVTISGTNLSTTSAVTFGSNPATVVSRTATAVVVTTPLGVPGAANVTVVNAVASATKTSGFVYQSSAVGTHADITFTNPDGSTTLPQAFTYTAPVPPTITSFTPTSGPTSGGGTVVVAGTGMTNALSATVCGFDAPITASTPTTASITVPSNFATSCAIAITNIAGTATSTTNYRYVAAPVLSSISASTGSIAGGQSVSLVGENLTDVTSIRFGTVVGTIVSKTATSLVATTPAQSAGLVNVSVTGIGGTATLTGAFTYSAPATIASMTPATGSTLGGTRTILTGTNLANASAVTVGGTNATIVSKTATTITLDTPAHAAGVVEVAVVTPAGRVARTSAFTYVAPARATVSSISPATGFTIGGTRVTLTGTVMGDVSAVRFGGTAATIVSKTATNVIVTTPAHAAGVVSVELVNPGGSTIQASGFTYTVAPMATVTSVSPLFGSALGGTRVTLTGTNLADVTEVLFGTVAGSIVSRTATSLVVTSPAVTAGVVSLSVTNTGGKLVKSNAYTFKNLPTLTSLSPVNGPVTVGNTVTLTGTNLGTASAVTFGTTAATITNRSATSVTVTVPAHAAGAVTVTVTTPDGTASLTNGYTYIAAPTITSVATATGPVAGGTTFTITGTNLALATSVTVGGISATISSRSATQIRAVSPVSDSTGVRAISVVTPGGTVTRASGFTYTMVQLKPATRSANSTKSVGHVANGRVKPAEANTATSPLANSFASKFAAQGTAKGSHGFGTTQSKSPDVVAQTNCTAASSVEPYHRCWSDADWDGGYSYDAETIWADSYIKSATPTVLTVDLVPYVPISDNNWLTYTDTYLEFDFDLDDDGISDIQVTPIWTALAANQSTSVRIDYYDFNTGSWATRSTACSGTITRKLADHAAITGTSNSWWQLNINWPCLFQGYSQSVTFSTYIEDYLGYDFAPDQFWLLSSADIGSILAPTLTSLTPIVGPTAGNTTVTLTGTKMSDVTAVYFDSDPATIVSRTATTVVVRTPPHAAGVVDVEIMNSAGSALKANAFTYQSAAPRVTSLSVSSGSSEGGTTVTATGVNLGTVSSVTVGGQSATITSKTSTTVTFITPAAMTAEGLPTDPKYLDGTLWGLDGTYGIDAPTAWPITQGDPNVVVAVIDTGGTSHPDAGGTVPGYDMVSLDDANGDGYADSAYSANDGDGRDSNPSDPGDWVSASEAAGTSAGGFFQGCTAEDSSWHGSHVSGTINAASNGSGMVGVAPGVMVEHVRALGKCGGYMSDIIAAIEWASGGTVSSVPANANPADVINMSLGGPGSCSTALQNAISNAVNRGTAVVVAAGNENVDASGSSPANCNNTITVGAVASTGLRAYFSNYGSRVDISAPGVGIYSTVNTGRTNPVSGGYALYSGTSMATPHVAGVVALILSAHPGLTPAQTETLLKSTAGSFGGAYCDASNHSISCGSGIANAGAAVQ